MHLWLHAPYLRYSSCGPFEIFCDFWAGSTGAADCGRLLYGGMPHKRRNELGQTTADSSSSGQ